MSKCPAQRTATARLEPLDFGSLDEAATATSGPCGTVRASIAPPRLGREGRAREIYLVSPLPKEMTLLRALDRASAALEGWSIEVRAPLPETLRELIAKRPPLVLAEVPQGDESAIDLAHRLHGALGRSAPPVIAIIDPDADASFEHAFADGAVDVLAAPVSLPLLRVKLERLARKPVASERAFGRFDLKRVLGRGANATVFLAEPRACSEAASGQLVALKVVPLELVQDEPEQLARFHRECEALRSLASTRIPRFFEAGRVDDCFYCAMEYIPGESLANVLRRAPLPDLAIESIIDDVAAALEELHAVGLVHRDVKPGNVIVTPAGTAKLVDFGLAKSGLDPSVTRTDEVLGTAPYMAPELARGSPACTTTDAFALGMTALEAALGGCPERETDRTLVGNRAADIVPRASDLLPERCFALRAALDGLLEPDPARRSTIALARAQLRGCLRREGTRAIVRSRLRPIPQNDSNRGDANGAR